MGEGYDNDKGRLKFEKNVQDQGELPEVSLEIMLNLGNPDTAFSLSQLPCEGIGLARLELVINNATGVLVGQMFLFACAQSIYTPSLHGLCGSCGLLSWDPLWRSPAALGVLP